MPQVRCVLRREQPVTDEVVLALGERKEQILTAIFQQDDRMAQYAVRVVHVGLQTMRLSANENVPLYGARALQKENARRKHNFIPLIYTLLQELAKRDRLSPPGKQAAS